MTRACKLLLVFLIVMVNAAVASAQSVFSVEEVSETEYTKAKNGCSRYNVIRADSIIDNEIVRRVVQESKAKFEQLDSFTRQELYYYIENDEWSFDTQRLIYLPELKLYGFCVPDTPFEDTVWWFDAENGSYICSAAYPFAINVNGMYVSQTGHDCDWLLELRFFCRDDENCYYEFESYKNTQYDGERIGYPDLSSIFWQENNTLYLKTYNFLRQEEVYLKIKL